MNDVNVDSASTLSERQREQKHTPNPHSVHIGEREYLVWFNDDGFPQTVMVVKSHGQQCRLDIRGLTARAAIAKAIGAA